MKGLEYLKNRLADITESPGVYKMSGPNGDALYIGKAKNLRKRITSYTQLYKLVPRIQRMVLQVESLETIITRTEVEALLLESNMIKNLRPHYNILLRDDKSFPYIMITGGHDFPRIAKHRGEKKDNNTYFGPFASAMDVNSAIATLQRAFLLRPCADSFFSSRTRPCLEYQIKRCSAPCVNRISKEEYALLVKQAKDLLAGKNHELKAELTRMMEEASNGLDFEKAAAYRDRIKAIANIQAKQSINTSKIENCDVIALYMEGNSVCVEVTFVRNYQTLGSKPYFPIQTEGFSTEEIMEAFLTGFYQNNPAPEMLITSHDIFGKVVLEDAFAKTNDHKVEIIFPQKGEKRALVEMTLARAKEAFLKKQRENKTETDLLEKLAELFNIDGEIKRVEVYDNSHTFGKQAVSAMIVTGPEGFVKNEYRKFNVTQGEKESGGDDYWMLRQVLTRRFRKLKETSGDSKKPDLVLIDGGVAHLTIAEEVFAELGINDVVFACIAKGPDRNAGKEEFHVPDKAPFRLPDNDPLLYFLQRLRDEAHRFAISSHRVRRTNSLLKSKLDEIPGIGLVRKKALLTHFGSVRGIEEATIDELRAVAGINKKTAEMIYNYLH